MKSQPKSARPHGETHLWAAASLRLAHNALALHRSARLAAASNLGLQMVTLFLSGP